MHARQVQAEAGYLPAQSIEALARLKEASRDISISLNALANTHEEWQDATLEFQTELLMVCKSMDKTVAQLADADSDLDGDSDTVAC